MFKLIYNFDNILFQCYIFIYLYSHFMVEDLLIYISLDKFIYKYLFTHCSISTQTKMGSL